MLDFLTSRLTIKKDKIIWRSIFRKIILLSKAIEGIVDEDNKIYVVPIDRRKKIIKISKFIDNHKRVLNILSKQYAEMTCYDSIWTESDMLNDERLGAKIEERKAKLKKAKKSSIIITGITFILSLWFVIYPYPFAFLLPALILSPIAVLLVEILSFGLFGNYNLSRNTYLPTLLYAFLGPSLALLVTLLKINIIDYKDFLVPVLVLSSIIFLFVMLLKKRNPKEKFYHIFPLFIYLNLFVFGALININTYFDNSEVELFKSKVLSKKISGNHYDRVIAISSWEHDPEERIIKISKKMYERVSSGKEIELEYRKGCLNISWYKLKKVNYKEK